MVFQIPVIIREFGINVYTLRYLKRVTNKDPLYGTGTLLKVMRQLGWEGSLGENGYMCMYDWVPSLFTWNYHNVVNWLCMFSCSVMSDSLRPHGLLPTMLLVHGFPRQECWSGLPLSSPGNISDSETQPASTYISCFASGFVITEPPEKSNQLYPNTKKKFKVKKFS